MKTSSHRLLVIDDSPEIHEDFRKVLCSKRGGASRLDAAEAILFGESRKAAGQSFEIDSAFQGQEGLARVFHALQEGRPYEIAFVDVRMPPGWDGIEVTPRLWIADPELQIVICTAYSDYTWEEMFARVGASDRMFILKKPFHREELLQLVHTLAARRQARRKSSIHSPHLQDSSLSETTEKFQTEIYRMKTEPSGEQTPPS